MREKGALTCLRVKYNCQSSLKLAQQHLIGNSTRNLTAFVFWPHTEKLTVSDGNSWSARLCFLTATPFYELITEVLLLTCYLRGYKLSKQSRHWWNGKLCCISSGSYLFAKVPVLGFPVQKGLILYSDCLMPQENQSLSYTPIKCINETIARNNQSFEL